MKRKTRIDKGKQRKPAPSERELWVSYFRRLTPDERRYEIGYLTAVADHSDTESSQLEEDKPSSGVLDLTADEGKKVDEQPAK